MSGDRISTAGDASDELDAGLSEGGQTLGGGSEGASRRLWAARITVETAAWAVCVRRDEPGFDVMAVATVVHVSRLSQFAIPQSSHAPWGATAVVDAGAISWAHSATLGPSPCEHSEGPENPAIYDRRTKTTANLVIIDSKLRDRARGFHHRSS